GSLFGGHQPHAIVYRGDLSLYPPSLSQRADSDRLFCRRVWIAALLAALMRVS
ncbi:LysR family transcriptional regulator, partial [Klebsiella pneumoniae]